MISAAIRAFPHDSKKLGENLNKAIPKFCVPLHATFVDTINKLAGKFKSEMVYKIKEVGTLFYGVDEGNKCGVQHCVKYFCTWSKKESRMKMLLLNLDTAGGTSIEVAAACM